VLISIAEGVGIKLWLPSIDWGAEWQSEAVFCNQQDKSQAEAESGAKTIKTDNIAVIALAILCIDPAILCIEMILLYCPKFLHLRSARWGEPLHGWLRIVSRETLFELASREKVPRTQRPGSPAFEERAILNRRT
jgi:hypothetical protein